MPAHLPRSGGWRLTIKALPASPVTRLAAGVMGRNNDVDNRRAKDELGWRTLVSYEDAMERIDSYLKTISL